MNSWWTSFDACRKATCRRKESSTILAKMSDGQRYETKWEGMRLVIDARPQHWQAFVYDIETCEVLTHGEKHYDPRRSFQ